MRKQGNLKPLISPNNKTKKFQYTLGQDIVPDVAQVINSSLPPFKPPIQNYDKSVQMSPRQQSFVNLRAFDSRNILQSNIQTDDLYHTERIEDPAKIDAVKLQINLQGTQTIFSSEKEETRQYESTESLLKQTNDTAFQSPLKTQLLKIQPPQLPIIHNKIDVVYLQALPMQHAIIEKFLPQKSPQPFQKLSKFSARDTLELQPLPETSHHSIQGSYQALRNSVLEKINQHQTDLINVRSSSRMHVATSDIKLDEVKVDYVPVLGSRANQTILNKQSEHQLNQNEIKITNPSEKEEKNQMESSQLDLIRSSQFSFKEEYTNYLDSMRSDLKNYTDAIKQRRQYNRSLLSHNQNALNYIVSQDVVRERNFSMLANKNLFIGQSRVRLPKIFQTTANTLQNQDHEDSTFLTNMKQPKQNKTTNKQIISVFKEGEKLSSDSPCYRFDLQAQIDKFYIYRNYKGKVQDPSADLKVQSQLYQRVLDQVIQAANVVLSDGQTKYQKLFTFQGDQIKNLADIQSDCTCLILCQNYFVPVSYESIHDNQEAAQAFSQRIIDSSGIKVDQIAPKQLKVKSFQKPRNIKFGISQTISHAPTPISYTKAKEIKEQMQVQAAFAAVQKRKSWCEKYSLEQWQLIELFSEFSGLMMIARQLEVEHQPDSIQSRFAKSYESKDYLARALPFQSGCNKTITMDKIEQQQKMKLTEKELRDFRVPVKILLENTLALKRVKLNLRSQVLNAFGISLEQPDSKVSWEKFLLLNQYIRYGNVDEDQLQEMFVRFFKPFENPVTEHQAEHLIDLLFGSDIHQNDQRQQLDSVAANMKQIFRINEIYDCGVIVSSQLRKALQTKIVDVEIFKNALK